MNTYSYLGQEIVEKPHAPVVRGCHPSYALQAVRDARGYVRSVRIVTVSPARRGSSSRCPQPLRRERRLLFVREQQRLSRSPLLLLLLLLLPSRISFCVVRVPGGLLLLLLLSNDVMVAIAPPLLSSRFVASASSVVVVVVVVPFASAPVLKYRVRADGGLAYTAPPRAKLHTRH